MDRGDDLSQKAAEISQSRCGEEGCCVLTLMDPDCRPNTTTIIPSGRRASAGWPSAPASAPERIAYSPDACVCVNSPEYPISLKGKMQILTDPAVKREMWYGGLADHFSGPEGPGYVALKLTADSLPFSSTGRR